MMSFYTTDLPLEMLFMKKYKGIINGLLLTSRRLHHDYQELVSRQMHAGSVKKSREPDTRLGSYVCGSYVIEGRAFASRDYRARPAHC